MINIYTYFSSAFNSDIKVVFTDDIISSFEILSTGQTKADIKNQMQFFIKREAFLKSAAEHKVKIVEVDREVSFDMFWQKYNLKDSGRKKAEEAWNKHPKEEQIKAFDFVSVLDRKLKMGAIAKPYATTYLNQKRWEQ